MVGWSWWIGGMKLFPHYLLPIAFSIFIKLLLLLTMTCMSRVRHVNFASTQKIIYKNTNGKFIVMLEVLFLRVLYTCLVIMKWINRVSDKYNLQIDKYLWISLLLCWRVYVILTARNLFFVNESFLTNF